MACPRSLLEMQGFRPCHRPAGPDPARYRDPQGLEWALQFEANWTNALMPSGQPRLLVLFTLYPSTSIVG